MTNLEAKMDTMIGQHPNKAYSMNATTTTGYVFLATVPTPAMHLWVYNPSSKTIEVRTGDQTVPIPAGQIGMVSFIKDLSLVSFRASDATAGTVVWFRYEV